MSGSYAGSSLKIRVLACSAIVGVSIALSGVSYAQIASPPQTTDQAADDKSDVALVVVTGSRIKRPNFDTLEPAQLLTGDRLDQRGFANIADALSEIPAFGVGPSAAGDQAANGVGQSFANFFGIGS